MSFDKSKTKGTIKSPFYDDVSRLSWQEFEVLVADYYRAQGYEVKHVGTGMTKTSTDGGIDLKIYKDGYYAVVQCKHWNKYQVEHNDMHQLLGVMTTQKASAAIIITSGEFTSAAIKHAKNAEQIELIDGAEIRRRLKQSGLSVTVKVPQSDYVLEQVEQYNKTPDNQTGSARNSQKMWDTERRKSKRSPKRILARLLFQIGVPILFCILAIKFLPGFIAGLIKPLQIAAPVLPAASAPIQARPANTDASNAASNKPEIAEISAADQAMNAEELREWKKRNEESMKLLEESTPELKD